MLPLPLLLPLLFGLGLGLNTPPCLAEPLRVERVDLGDTAAGVQAYKLQEGLAQRVFARSQAGFRASRLFIQRRSADGDQWLAAEPLPFSDPRWRDSDPHLSADGRHLSFASDRGGQGGMAQGPLDLYESHWDGNGWSAPQRLAETLQSPAYELGPARHGERLFFSSSRAGGPGRLSIYQAGTQGSAPRPLPAPINEGEFNSDFSLTADGRYAVWWSSRAGAAGGPGDLYLAERVGEAYGPALRLPEPINGPGMEFGPSVSADGRWLYFASTRDDPAAAEGLAHVYRVGWPELLQALGPAAQAFSQAALDAQVDALWRSLSHAPGQAPDTQRLAQLMHPAAQIFGQTLKDAQLGLKRWEAAKFLQGMKSAASAQGFLECELHREQRRYGAHAQVYSVVESRFAPASGRPPNASYTGVNSMQWQLGAQGWQLLSLHYALALPGQPPLSPRPAEEGAGRPCPG